MNKDYSDIINLPRPTSKHSKMDLILRAKQFSPFAALGHLETPETSSMKKRHIP
ncbi:hypothetical protein IKE71_01850 [Candidatus Saccharibacteria bacterium]|nr:hypothetical protein [Candidatus Saccharibacteria bacterium]